MVGTAVSSSQAHCGKNYKKHSSAQETPGNWLPTSCCFPPFFLAGCLPLLLCQPRDTCLLSPVSWVALSHLHDARRDHWARIKSSESVNAPKQSRPKKEQYILFKIEEHTRASHRGEGLCIVPSFQLNPWGKTHSFVMRFFEFWSLMFQCWPWGHCYISYC